MEDPLLVHVVQPAKHLVDDVLHPVQRQGRVVLADYFVQVAIHQLEHKRQMPTLWIAGSDRAGY